MSTLIRKIGPADSGRRMSLDDFDTVQCVEGHRYELSRGVITVDDIPHPRHLAQIDVTRTQIAAHRLSQNGRIHAVGGAAECKLLIADLESERHPDIAIYKNRPPKGDNVWSEWIPEIVIEVISESSRYRDYQEKPEEYLRFGVIEYWILDADKGEMLVMKRWRGRWAEQFVRPPETYRTHLLPGLAFDCGSVFEAARE